MAEALVAGAAVFAVKTLVNKLRELLTEFVDAKENDFGPIQQQLTGFTNSLATLHDDGLEESAAKPLEDATTTLTQLTKDLVAATSKKGKARSVALKKVQEDLEACREEFELQLHGTAVTLAAKNNRTLYLLSAAVSALCVTTGAGFVCIGRALNSSRFLLNFLKSVPSLVPALRNGLQLLKDKPSNQTTTSSFGINGATAVVGSVAIFGMGFLCGSCKELLGSTFRGYYGQVSSNVTGGVDRLAALKQQAIDQVSSNVTGAIDRLAVNKISKAARELLASACSSWKINIEVAHPDEVTESEESERK